MGGPREGIASERQCSRVVKGANSAPKICSFQTWILHSLGFLLGNQLVLLCLSVLIGNTGLVMASAL